MRLRRYVCTGLEACERALAAEARADRGTRLTALDSLAAARSNFCGPRGEGLRPRMRAGWRRGIRRGR